MTTIGAYTFVSSRYRELDFPLDLWIEWNSKFFDQLSLVTYGHIDVPPCSNLIVTEMVEPDSDSFDFYLFGMEGAQRRLTTDWRISLPADEFVSSRIPTNTLDTSRTYALKMRHLYGNINTEIHGSFPPHYFRLHYGVKRIIGDGGAIAGPYDAKIIFSRALRFGLWRYLKVGQHVSPLEPRHSFEVFHTGACRSPRALSKKWREQIEIEVDEGFHDNEQRFDILNATFNYHDFKRINKLSYLTRVSDQDLPGILKSNRDRFDHAQFSSDEYSIR